MLYGSENAATSFKTRAQLTQYLPVVEHFRITIEHRRRKLCRVADREEMKRYIVVIALEWGSCGKNYIRVTRRLVYVAVDRHHEFKRLKCDVELSAVRGREYGVAGERYQRFDLVFPLGQYLFRENRDRKLAARLRQIAHAAAPTTEATLRRERLRCSHRIERRQRKHRAAFAIEIARHDIQNIYQPLANTTERLRAETDPPVTDRRLCRCKFGREHAYFVRIHPGDIRYGRGRKLADKFMNTLHTIGERLERSKLRQLFIYDHMDQSKQQKNICPGTNEQMLIRKSRRFRKTRIHDNDFSAAGLNVA